MMLNEVVTESGLTRIPVSRALAKLKTLKAKIDEQLANPAKLFHLSQGVEKKRLLTPGETFDTIGAKSQSWLQSVQKNMDNYLAIKSAIALSNATTIVTINGKQYTIAGVMELKKIQESKTKLVNIIKRQHHDASTVAARNNENLEKELTVNKADNKEALDQETQVQMFARLQEMQRELSLVNIEDTIGHEAVVKNLSDELEAVKTDLDYVINQSNMVTVIEVDLR